MIRTFLQVGLKLTLLVLLSSAGAFTASRAEAHELQPTIADLTVEQGTLTLDLRLNVEALLADIDLDAVEDTDDAANVADYDALRALSGQEVAIRALQLLETWNALPMIVMDGDPVVLQAGDLIIPEDVDIELARLSDWKLTADVPVDAQSVTVSWPDGSGALVLRQQGVDAPFTGYLDGGDTSEDIVLTGGNQMGFWGAFASYIPVGFDHIVPQGLDHILFVLGLFFLSTKLGALLWQVSAFTLAHTVTLALGALGLVNVPGSIVEPLIAASIVYVAVENIFASGHSRLRPAIVFAFGLLHGLGFASVLGEFGLPEGQFIPALIGFNVGVEVGQLAVIAVAAFTIWLAVQAARMARLNGLEEEVREYGVMFRAVSITGSLIIAIIGVWWVIERTLL